jgi:hypothetical protein
MLDFENIGSLDSAKFKEWSASATIESLEGFVKSYRTDTLENAEEKAGILRQLGYNVDAVETGNKSRQKYKLGLSIVKIKGGDKK